MKEFICGAIGLLCSNINVTADDKAPFNRRVDLPLATVSWDIEPSVVNKLIRDYLTSQGQTVKTSVNREFFDCGSYYSNQSKTCHYVIWVEVPFDATKP